METSKLLLSRMMELAKSQGRIACAILQGEPGSGKTFYTSQRAKDLSARYFFYQANHWTTVDDLYRSINIASVILQDEKNVFSDGAALAAAKASQTQKVVLCVDEIDKAPQKVEDALLDFLQSGRIDAGSGQSYQVNFENIEIYLTSNGSREHSNALLRRCFCAEFKKMSSDFCIAQISEACGLDSARAKKIYSCKPQASLQELINFAKSMILAKNQAELVEIAKICLCRFGDLDKTAVAALWRDLE